MSDWVKWAVIGSVVTASLTVGLIFWMNTRESAVEDSNVKEEEESSFLTG